MPTRFRLAEVLAELEVSQRELARRSGLSPTIINRMVNNLAQQVALSTLDKLAAALGIEPQEFIVREQPRRRRK
jgi:putative transcriptional regulator